MGVSTELPILTPEKTVITYRLAGLGVRVAAHLVDLFAFAIAYAVASMVFGLYASLTGTSGMIGATLMILASLGAFVYFILFEGLWNGQTIGKKVFGLRVRMADGTPITFGAALGRNLIRPADMLPGPYLLGIGAMFLNPKSQRIGDLVANTVVTYDRLRDVSFRAAPHRVGMHAMEDLVGDLQGMTRQEYDALRQFMDRYDKIPAPVQEQLFRELWDPIAKRRHIPNPNHVHPLGLAEATVMKYGRQHGLL